MISKCGHGNQTLVAISPYTWPDVDRMSTLGYNIYLAVMRGARRLKFLGKYAEYLILTNLLKRNLEAYSAIKTNQDYDITVITDKKTIVRVQVKATELGNQSTNNVIPNVEKKYDFFVLVVVTASPPTEQIYILTKDEVSPHVSSGQLYTTEKVNGTKQVRSFLNSYLDQWSKIEKA